MTNGDSTPYVGPAGPRPSRPLGVYAGCYMCRNLVLTARLSALYSSGKLGLPAAA